MFRIKGYEPGANITLLNAIYHKSRRDNETGKYGTDSIDLVFKDLDTGEKKLYHIEEPSYTYYMAKETISTNMLFISNDQAEPVTCKYRQLQKSIAENTNNLNFFYDNILVGNYKANDALFTLPNIFNADMNIEDYYRMEFDRTYKNEAFEPSVMYFDIETDNIEIGTGFPDPEEALCPINAVTLVDDKNKQIYTLLLDDPDNETAQRFKEEKDILEQLKEFVKEKVGGYKQWIRYGLDKFKYNIMYYDEEIKLIKDVFNVINIVKPDFAVAWNIAFDITYFIHRLRRLGYNPADVICGKDFPVKECWYFVDRRAQKFEERGDYGCISSFTVYIDQMILFASRRKGQKKGAITSHKLDFIGQVVAHVRKLSYAHITKKFFELVRKDYKVFVFYNVMDTIVQLCIERKVGDLSFLLNKVLSTNTRYAKVHRQTTYLVNRGVKDFNTMGYTMGDNINGNNEKAGFAGAFVADPRLVSDKPKMKINGKPINILPNCDDFDYKALYPSIMDENNIAPNTQAGKIILPEQLDKNEDRFINPYFDRAVWFIEDLVSHDRLNFCHRYLNLASYQEMYHDVIKYFTLVKNPSAGGLKYIDSRTGKRDMCTIINPIFGRDLCRIVDNTKPRNKQMCYIIDKMPRKEL